MPQGDPIPNAGYETEEDLPHPQGSKYSLPWEEAANFSDEPLPKTLPPGTKLYRIIGSNRPNGPYWSYELPKGLAEWREGSAVKESWNSNGKYVEYTVGPEGLNVWEGVAASQDFERQGAKEWLYSGGDLQLFVPHSGEIIPDNLPIYLTPWSK